MGKGFRHGSSSCGDGLNFKVVDGTVEPESGKENTIWVNTSNKVTGYYFQASQPANMAEGEVWFYNGLSSPVSFNALKKNSIYLYPASAKQFINGKLVNVTAKTYQNGAWKDWFVYLIQNGVETVNMELYTGVGANSIVMEKAQETDSIIYALSSEQYGYGAYGMYYKVFDLTGINTIEINASISTEHNDSCALAVLSGLPSDTNDTSFDDVTVASVGITSASKKTVSLDVSSLTGVNPVGLLIKAAFNMTLTVSDFRCV